MLIDVRLKPRIKRSKIFLLQFVTEILPGFFQHISLKLAIEIKLILWTKLNISNFSGLKNQFDLRLRNYLDATASFS